MNAVRAPAADGAAGTSGTAVAAPVADIAGAAADIAADARAAALADAAADTAVVAVDATADTAAVAADARASALADVAAAVDSAGDLYRRASRVRRHCGPHVPRSAGGPVRAPVNAPPRERDHPPVRLEKNLFSTQNFSSREHTGGGDHSKLCG